jgi:hypothetical protein
MDGTDVFSQVRRHFVLTSPTASLAMLPLFCYGMEEVVGSNPIGSTSVMSRDIVDTCLATSFHFPGCLSRGWGPGLTPRGW